MKFILIFLIFFGVFAVEPYSAEYQSCYDLCNSHNFKTICEIKTKIHISCEKIYPNVEQKLKCPENKTFVIDIEKKFVAVSSSSELEFVFILFNWFRYFQFN